MNLSMLSVAFFIGLISIASAFGGENPSWFQEDENAVLWFQRGDDKETKYSSSLNLSAVTDGIVITVIANDQHLSKAVQLAIRMRDAMQKHKDAPDKVFVVAYKSDNVKGVGYRFYTDGTAYDAEDEAKIGMYPPAKAQKVLRGVLLQLQILKADAAKGKWGMGDHKRKALEIRRFNG